MGGDGSFGIGTLLVVEIGRSRKLLFARKSYRLGYEGSDQYTFPGGMVRSHHKQAGMVTWLQTTLRTRVATEVGLDITSHVGVKPLDVTPPVVACYTVQGQRKHTVILPFILSITKTFLPRVQDTTVYNPGWHVPTNIWGEITATNRLIAAYYLWHRLSEAEKVAAQPFLDDALNQAFMWAAEVKLPPPPRLQAHETSRSF